MLHQNVIVTRGNIQEYRIKLIFAYSSLWAPLGKRSIPFDTIYSPLQMYTKNKKDAQTRHSSFKHFDVISIVLQGMEIPWEMEMEWKWEKIWKRNGPGWKWVWHFSIFIKKISIQSLMGSFTAFKTVLTYLQP